jgi:zeaxanthin epoxidase
VIDRPDLQEILIDECKKIKPVTGYESHGRGRGVTVQLSSGESSSADVLVGSDGIWSQIRAQMYQEGYTKQSSPDKKMRQGCPYSGYTVFAGETVLKTNDYYDTGYKVYIGPKRYFVTSDVGDGRIQWYAFFALPPGSKKAPSGWGGSVRGNQADPEENLVDYIKGLHEGWTDEIMAVLDATPPESVEQRDLYDRRPELFRSWADGNVVLIGDAVHAMMPNLGQGGCQAIEDAYVLGEVLAETRSTDRIQDALQEFYRKRIVRVSIVQFLSRLASDLIINAFDTPWSPHDNLGQSWKSYLTFFWKPILQYVIFPMQFAYLYSFYPSGSMRETAKNLEATWKQNHFNEAEASFAQAEKGVVRESSPSFFQKSNVPATVLQAMKES